VKKIAATICSLLFAIATLAGPQRRVPPRMPQPRPVPVHPRPVGPRPVRPQPPRKPEPPRRPDPPRHPKFPRDGRRLGRDHHSRVDRHRDVRERNGRREIFFGGFWFECGVVTYWPEWVFTDEVYVEMVGPDVYIMYDFNDPALQIYVYIVDDEEVENARAADILRCPEISKGVEKIWDDTAGAGDGTEYCFTVEPDSLVFFTGKYFSCFLMVDEKSVATFHTHPDGSQPQPSARDIADAVQCDIPFYVISEHQIWVARPDGRVALIGLR
jgi:hypothetical protein